MKYILYLVFRKKNIALEAISSIKSFFYITSTEQRQLYRIVIYTDLVDMFKNAFPDNKLLIIEELTEQIVKKWLDGTTFIYRLKNCMLQNFFKKYSSKAIYFDTDTFFMKDIGSLFDKIDHNKFIMHNAENTLKDKLDYMKTFTYNPYEIPLFYNHLRESNIISYKDHRYELPYTMQIWNSGVIGMSPSNLNLLEEALTLSSIIYDQFENILGEQYALAYFFQKHGNITACDDIIFHYWFLKYTKYLIEYILDKDFDIKNENEFLEFIKKYQLERLLEVKLDYKDLPILLTCIANSKFHPLIVQRMALDIPAGSYLGKIFLGAETYHKYANLLYSKYKIDLRTIDKNATLDWERK